MKKNLFAIVLGLILALSSFSVRAVENIAPGTTQTPELQSSPSEDAAETVDNNQLTIEVMQEMSWEELVNAASLIKVNYNETDRLEDYYTTWLISELTERMTVSIYHDMECISKNLGFSIGNIDYNHLIQKYQCIIDVYNAYNNLQLVWETTISNGNFMQIDIWSTNVDELNHPATYVGQKVRLKEGATYWESSQNDGSGRCGIATVDNAFIPEDFVVTVNGFAYFDESRTEVLKSYYRPYSSLEGQENAVKIIYYNRRMLHICTETIDLGWVYAEDVFAIDD